MAQSVAVRKFWDGRLAFQSGQPTQGFADLVVIEAGSGGFGTRVSIRIPLATSRSTETLVDGHH